MIRGEHIEGGLVALIVVHIVGIVISLLFRPEAAPLFIFGLIFAGGSLAVFYRVTRGRIER